jgi:hypothetical protein
MNPASEAKKNSTKFIREFEWIFNITLLQRRGAACTAPRRLNLLATLSYPLPNLTVTWLEQFPLPAWHTLYV